MEELFDYEERHGQIAVYDREENEKTEPEAETQADKIKRKRELLREYMRDPEAGDEDLKKILERYGDDVPYTVREALDLVQNNFVVFPEIVSRVTSYSVFFDKHMGVEILRYAKNNNPLGLQFNIVSGFRRNPYSRQGISDAEFDAVWKMYRRKFPDVKDCDKDLTADLFSFEDIKRMAGYNNDSRKEKADFSDISEDARMVQPRTRGELKDYWRKLLLVHGYKDNLSLGNINERNEGWDLSLIKAAFITLGPNEEESRDNTIYDFDLNMKSKIGLDDEEYIIINISPLSSPDPIPNVYEVVFLRVLDCLGKNVIFLPTDRKSFELMNCSDPNTFYKYGRHVISGCALSDDFELIKSILQKTPPVKRENNFTLENLVVNMRNCMRGVTVEKMPQSSSIINDFSLPKIEGVFSYDSRGKMMEYWELEKFLKAHPGYTIVNCSRRARERNGSWDKRGNAYVVLRNGDSKLVVDVNPQVKFAYSLRSDALVEEPTRRLKVVGEIHQSEIYRRREELKKANENQRITFYNSDFEQSTYITSHIRNRIKYEEGNSTPRIVALDFETSKGAIMVKGDHTSTLEECRLATIFDFQSRVFYTCVLIKEDHDEKEVEKLSRIKEHDGYKTNIYLVKNEADLWGWLNDVLNFLDPDILTGWNVENFDLIFGIVRSATLGVPLRGKHGLFRIIETRDMYKFGVICDGVSVISYDKLYKFLKDGGQESYSLDYICQVELKNKKKREKVTEDHDEMYRKYLVEYTLYNIEDCERILDLENTLNYMAFEFEMCRVCFVAWDDIMMKTRLIDGLIYNFSWDEHKTLLAETPRSEQPSIKRIMYDNLVRFCAKTKRKTIANGEIDLEKCIARMSADLAKKTDKNGEEKKEKKFEGAVVLESQPGLHGMTADLDASQMYPRIMIRSNIFKDTLCASIAIDNEYYAVKWLYDRENFPSEILVQMHNTGDDCIKVMTKKQFARFLEDKIITTFGTIYWKPSKKRSLVSNILIKMIANRNHYKNLMKQADRDLDNHIQNGGSYQDEKGIELSMTKNRYHNLQTAYKQIINSFYGAMGKLDYRLADIFSAATITASGRELTRMVSHFASRYMDEMIAQKKKDVPFESVPIDCKQLIGLESVQNRRNVLYGDTDSSFLLMENVLNSIYGKDVQDSERISHTWDLVERISEFINEYVIHYILQRKGIDPNDEDKDYNYEYKKEFVMSRIFFMDGKKMYASHVVLENGIRTYRNDIKGMQLKKSDNSRFSRNIGSEMIEYILGAYDREHPSDGNRYLLEKYREYEESLRKLIKDGDESIGKPVSFNGNLEEYLTVQANIRGMLLYDTIFDHEFAPGSKGYQVNIESIDWELLGTNEAEVKRKFEQKYSSYPWYEGMMRTNPEKLFKSITFPQGEKINTNIFRIDEEKTISGVLERKVEKIFQALNVKVFTEKSKKKIENGSGMIAGSVDDDLIMMRDFNPMNIL